jgi:hypothetical protein
MTLHRFLGGVCLEPKLLWQEHKTNQPVQQQWSRTVRMGLPRRDKAGCCGYIDGQKNWPEDP